MNGKWDQNFLFPGGSGTRNLSTSSSPMSTLSSNYRGAGGSFITDTTTTTYVTGPGTVVTSDWPHGNHTYDAVCPYRCVSFPRVLGGSPLRQDMIRGGIQTTDVIMRKRSENRGYMDENIRDSIVMGELSSKFPDLGKLQSAAED